jgi:iron(III) transport system permease protein
VPGIILACGYIFAWNAPYLAYAGIGGATGIEFYGTVWLLLAAYIGGSLPYATRLNVGTLDQVGQTLLDAARVQGAGLTQLLVRIIGPLLRSSLVSIWLLVFTGTMFELAASELLYPPGQPTMPVLIVGLFGTFRFGQGMALAMLNIGLVALALIVLRFIPWLLGHLTRSNARRKTIHVS